MTESTKTAVDGVDRRIIRILQADGRTTHSDIARTLGVTETTIRKRVGALLDGGFIKIVAVPTPKAAGRSMSAILGVSVSLRFIKEVAEHLSACPEVRYIGISSGRYELIVEAFVDDHEHLLDFVSERIGGLEGVTGVETSIVLKVAKFSYEWEIS
jgi:Lrp/AsnC family transcriptional regulator for asnA, asnC and gidA